MSWTTEEYLAWCRKQQLPESASGKATKPSKYRNVKTVINGETFDSKREASYWQGLLAREAAGEITGLRRQVPFELRCPNGEGDGSSTIVAYYLADFVFWELGVQCVVDAKGKRTAMYQLKKKWLELQDGIVIEEV